MRFYQDDKPGLVWNPKADRLAVEFVNGVCEADESQAEILKANGYRYDEPEPEVTPEPEPIVTPEPAPKPKRTTRRKKK